MKITFYQLSLISLCWLTLSSIVDSKLLADEVVILGSQEIAQNTSPQYSFEDYKKECLQRSATEGLPPQDAQKLCNCTINRFRDRYSIQEFRALIQKSKNNKTAAETLSQVGESCFEEILYEQ